MDYDLYIFSFIMITANVLGPNMQHILMTNTPEHDMLFRCSLLSNIHVKIHVSWQEFSNMVAVLPTNQMPDLKTLFNEHRF